MWSVEEEKMGRGGDGKERTLNCPPLFFDMRLSAWRVPKYDL